MADFISSFFLTNTYIHIFGEAYTVCSIKIQICKYVHLKCQSIDIILEILFSPANLLKVLVHRFTSQHHIANVIHQLAFINCCWFYDFDARDSKSTELFKQSAIKLYTHTKSARAVWKCMRLFMVCCSEAFLFLFF